ncbi:MAG: HAMP domain-containing histidine kinase [Oscillospiraceae bacterium]|nr:HAMP domain-containing histidine kinase [Oscillospiraceae bacterium]
MRSIYFKNFLATVSMVILSFFLLAGAFISIGRNLFVIEAREQMEANAAEVARAASAYARSGDLHSLDLRMTLSSVASATGRHIFITTTGGFVLTCSDRMVNCAHIGRRLDSSVMQHLHNGNEYYAFDTLAGFYDKENYVVARPFPQEGTPLGYVFVAQDSSSALYAWKAVMPLFLMLCVAVLCLALILSFFNSRRLARPLHDMADAARKFGHGDFSVRVESTEQDDELGELTEAFNAMAASLEKSEEQRREFVANVSHELKTPMTTISGFVDGILDGTIPPERQRRYLETISAETKRLSRLVRSMLELSRLQAEDRSVLCQKSFDIAEVLRRTLINFADKINAQQLDVDFQVPEDPIVVLGDVDAITQVVYNLLDNAIKFSRPGGILALSLWKDSAKAYVSVRNLGSTIPESEIPLLFDRFHKTDRSRSRDKDGVGLGLYIVKTILNNHGEDIAVTSRDGATDFVFTLTLK